MNPQRRSLSLVLSAVLWIIAAGTAAAQDPSPIRVTVYETLDGGRATYHYAITNNGDRPITVVRIGQEADSGDFSLATPPSGWTFDNGIVLMAKSVGVVDVFIPGGDLIQPLTDERGEIVRNVARIARIGDAVNHAAGEAQSLIEFSDKHQARIRGERAAGKIDDSFGWNPKPSCV